MPIDYNTDSDSEEEAEGENFIIVNGIPVRIPPPPSISEEFLDARNPIVRSPKWPVELHRHAPMSPPSPKKRNLGSTSTAGTSRPASDHVEQRSLVEILKQKPGLEASKTKALQDKEILRQHRDDLQTIAIFIPRFLLEHPNWTNFSVFHHSTEFIASRLDIDIQLVRTELWKELTKVLDSIQIVINNYFQC